MTAPARRRGRVGGEAVASLVRKRLPAAVSASPVAQKRPKVSKDASALKTAVRAMSEAAFQRSVVASLRGRGYVVWVFPIMKRTIAGVPDLTFFHPGKPGRLFFWELKTEKGRVRPEQAIAIAHLSTVPGVDARIVRPSQWRALSEEV